MIPAKYYQLVYMLIIIIVSIPELIRYYNDPEAHDESPSNALLFTIFITLFVALRPIDDYFADGPGYAWAMLDHRFENMPYSQWNNQFVFVPMMAFMSSVGVSPRMSYIILATIYYGCVYFAFRKMFPYNTLLAMLLFCGTFGVFGGAVNGIRNGGACSLFIVALAYRDKWWICLLFLVLSLGYHHSLELSCGAFVVSCFYKNTKHYYLAWFVCLLLAMAHVTYFQTLLGGFTDEHGAGYLITNADSWVTGFRLDFILYSAAPLALGWWVKSQIDIEDSSYACYLNVYLLMNSIWLLCMYAAFTNRISALSWSLFPILILEPLLKYNISDNQHKVLVWFVIGQLAFTLLMAILYI